MLIGYARVSKRNQDLQLQLDALTEAGCEKIFTDKASALKKDRTGLSDAMEFARPGDTLVVWKLDRLDRTTLELLKLVREFEKRGIEFRSLTDGINTQGGAGGLSRALFHLTAVFAEMEHALILERTMAGLAAANRKGRFGGRRPIMTPNKTEAARQLLNSGMDAKKVAISIGVSLATLYRHLPARNREDLNKTED